MAKKKRASLNKEKQHEVLVTNPEAHAKVKGFIDDKNLGRKPMMLDKYGRAIIRDDGIASEIEQRYGKYGTKEVTVVTVDKTPEPGHKYTFSVPEMPWKKEQDAERKRLPQEEQEETKEEEEEIDAL